jgi:anti-anti-sigma regulatory factor
MRMYGAAAGGSPGDSAHSCLAFSADEDFTEAALGFLADGLRANQRLVYLTGRSRPRAMADLARLDAAALVARGALRIDRVDETFDLAAPLDPDVQLARFHLAVQQASADGYSGMRVAAEVTAMVRDPARRAAHIRSEQRADRFMSSGHPLAALCGYDRRVLPEEVVADLAAVHPFVRGACRPPQVRVYFAAGRLVLAGCLDAFTSIQARRLLTTSHPEGGDVVLDVRRLDFADARGTSTLARWGADLVHTGGSLRIEGASGLLCKVWRLLGLHDVQGVELVGEA